MISAGSKPIATLFPKPVNTNRSCEFNFSNAVLKIFNSFSSKPFDANSESVFSEPYGFLPGCEIMLGVFSASSATKFLTICFFSVSVFALLKFLLNLFFILSSRKFSN
jgi:hypothetical protein